MSVSRNRQIAHIVLNTHIHTDAPLMISSPWRCLKHAAAWTLLCLVLDDTRGPLRYKDRLLLLLLLKPAGCRVTAASTALKLKMEDGAAPEMPPHSKWKV